MENNAIAIWKDIVLVLNSADTSTNIYINKILAPSKCVIFHAGHTIRYSHCCNLSVCKSLLGYASNVISYNHRLEIPAISKCATSNGRNIISNRQVSYRSTFKSIMTYRNYTFRNVYLLQSETPRERGRSYFGYAKWNCHMRYVSAIHKRSFYSGKIAWKRDITDKHIV